MNIECKIKDELSWILNAKIKDELEVFDRWLMFGEPRSLISLRSEDMNLMIE